MTRDLTLSFERKRIILEASDITRVRAGAEALGGAGGGGRPDMALAGGPDGARADAALAAIAERVAACG